MKKNIALLAGGFTGESVVSYNSAKQIESQLDIDLFNVYKIIVTKEEWYYLDHQNQKHQINKNDFSIVLEGVKITFEAVFIIIHGSPGEDGKFQSYFDLLNIPAADTKEYKSACAKVAAMSPARPSPRAIPLRPLSAPPTSRAPC